MARGWWLRLSSAGLFTAGVQESRKSPAIVARGTSAWDRLEGMSVSTSAPAGPPLSTGEAASELGVSERTLRRYISAGLIGFRRLPGGHYRIPREAIAEFWSRHSPPPRRSARRMPLVAHPPRPRMAGDASTETGARRPRLSATRQPRSYEVPPAERDNALARDFATGAHTNRELTNKESI